MRNVARLLLDEIGGFAGPQKGNPLPLCAMEPETQSGSKLKLAEWRVLATYRLSIAQVEIFNA